MKIKQIIHIILLSFTIVLLFIFGMFMIYENDRNIESIMNENLAVSSGAQIMDIENFCKGRKADMEFVAQWSMTQNAVAASLGEAQTLPDQELSYLKNILAAQRDMNSFSESLTIVDRNFHVVAGSEVSAGGEVSALKNSNKKYLSGEFSISDIVNPDEKGNENKIVAAIAGIYKGEELTGYVVEEISVTFFDQIRTETNLWKEGTLYLLDGDRKMITAGNGEEESRQNFVLSKQELEDYTEAWNNIDFEKEPVGKIKYRAGGDKWLTYYSDILYTDWQILISVNLSSYQEKKTAYITITLVTLLAVAALLIVINYFLSARLTKPIENIVHTLKNVQKNQDYSLRVGKHSDDEIGSLAGEVNYLLTYIQRENLQEKERQRYLRRKAEHDSLTEVYNKKAIEDRVKDMLWSCSEEGSTAAVAVIDVDDFKNFNTQYGHQGGDRVLKYIASCLKKVEGGLVGRIGGDEFLLGIKAVRNLDELIKTTEKLLDEINIGIYDKATEKNIPVSCCIGIAVSTGGNCHFEEMFHKADSAMYEVKEAGKNTYRIVT